MRKLDGWTLFKAGPNPLSVSAELGLETDPSGRHLDFSFESQWVELMSNTSGFDVVGFHTKAQKDGSESSIVQLTLANAIDTELLMTLRGDIFGTETRDGLVKSLINFVLTRTPDGEFAVCVELFVNVPDGGTDVWILSSTVDSLEASYKAFSEYLHNESFLMFEADGAPMDVSINWMFGTSVSQLTTLGVKADIGGQILDESLFREAILTITTESVKIDIFHSEDPTMLRVVRSLHGRKQREVASISSGPAVASVILAGLAPLVVNNRKTWSESVIQSKESSVTNGQATRITIPEFSAGQGCFVIDDAGVRLLESSGVMSSQKSVHPQKLYSAILQCFEDAHVLRRIDTTNG